MSDGNDYVNFFKTCAGRAVGWLSQYLSYPRGYPHGIVVTITEEVKVIRVGNSLRIAIQNVFCKALGIEEGHSQRLSTTNGDILVSPLQRKDT